MTRDEEEPLTAACAELRDLRRTFETEQQRLIACRDQRLAEWHATAVPQPAKNRAGASVQALLRARGWTDEDLKLAGVSSPTVRVVLDRAQREQRERQPAATA